MEESNHLNQHPMKISTLITLGIIALVAFYLGRLFEKSVTVQAEVTVLKSRVSELENVNAKREQHWKWVKFLTSKLPLVTKFTGHF